MPAPNLMTIHLITWNKNFHNLKQKEKALQGETLSMLEIKLNRFCEIETKSDSSHND